MPKTESPSEFPRAGDGGGLTPHDLSQLTMTSQRNCGGFRLLYPNEGPMLGRHATLVYAVERPQDGYSYTVVSPRLTKEMSQDRFRTDIVPRSQTVDPPEEWASAAWDAFQGRGVAGVQEVLRIIEEEQAEHLKKNRRVAEVRHG